MTHRTATEMADPRVKEAVHDILEHMMELAELVDAAVIERERLQYLSFSLMRIPAEEDALGGADRIEGYYKMRAAAALAREIEIKGLLAKETRPDRVVFTMCLVQPKDDGQ